MNTTEHNALQLAEKLEQLKKSESDLITERDYRDEVIDRMADAVLGTDRAEWSSSYDLIDAAQEVEDFMVQVDATNTKVEKLKAEIGKLQQQLIAEAKKTAEEKLRADQLDKQHTMQSRMHAEANQNLTTLRAAAPEPEAWLATFRPKGMLYSHSIAGANLEELKLSVPSDSVFKPLYTLPADGVSTQTETLRAELVEETEAAENWRRLALQFDNHRMQALGHLKAILHPDSSVDEYKAAELFLKAPPLDGESVLAQRIAKLSAAATQVQADALDAARLLYATKDYDGYVHMKRDKYEFTLECMEEAGRSEPTIEDELNGVRRLIDAAIAAQTEKGEQSND